MAANEGGDCVEVAFDTEIHVRDSKVLASPQLHLTAPAWAAFISAVQPVPRILVVAARSGRAVAFGAGSCERGSPVRVDEWERVVGGRTCVYVR
ncbi:DUF397 domain-containing protein [Streptomyces sp. cg40]|uniref:DUF397 domain-containing protein n=1 Tax=Streptomyces sp. cg40 TaxID=3419764 RepID=UPI003CFEB1D5